MSRTLGSIFEESCGCREGWLGLAVAFWETQAQWSVGWGFQPHFGRAHVLAYEQNCTHMGRGTGDMGIGGRHCGYPPWKA